MGRLSSVDIWIGGAFGIKRTSLGISEQEFRVSLSIDRNDITAFEAGEKRVNANLLIPALPNLWMYDLITF